MGERLRIMLSLVDIHSQVRHWVSTTHTPCLLAKSHRYSLSLSVRCITGSVLLIVMISVIDIEVKYSHIPRHNL